MRFFLSNQLNDTSGLGNLLLSLLADVSCADNDGDRWQAALSEQLGVAEGGQVDDGCCVGLGVCDVLLTQLGGDERPQL